MNTVSRAVTIQKSEISPVEFRLIYIVLGQYLGGYIADASVLGRISEGVKRRSVIGCLAVEE